jgi:hypothetical protein
MINEHQKQHDHENEATQPDLLTEEQLLTALNELASKFDYGRVRLLPDIDTNTIQKLAGIKIAIVDDVSGHLINAGMDLLVASNNNLALIHHTNQSYTALLNEIIAVQPDIILLDYELCNGIRGVDLISDLKRSLPDVCIIGHSSSFGYNMKLIESGAHGSINKPSEDVATLTAELYETFLLKHVPKESKTTSKIIQNFDTQTTRDGSIVLENELLLSLNLLCEGFLISTATAEELNAMGMPVDIAEHILSNPERLTGCNLEYWTSPFQVGDYDKIAKVSEGAKYVLKLIELITNNKLDDINRTLVSGAHEQLNILIQG